MTCVNSVEQSNAFLWIYEYTIQNWLHRHTTTAHMHFLPRENRIWQWTYNNNNFEEDLKIYDDVRKNYWKFLPRAKNKAFSKECFSILNLLYLRRKIKFKLNKLKKLHILQVNNLEAEKSKIDQTNWDPNLRTIMGKFSKIPEVDIKNKSKWYPIVSFKIISTFGHL